jgi:hypothetical protein
MSGLPTSVVYDIHRTLLQSCSAGKLASVRRIFVVFGDIGNNLPKSGSQVHDVCS